MPPASRELIHLSFAPVVKKAAPAVVNVFSRRVVKSGGGPSALFNDPFFRRFFGDQSPFGVPRERVEQSLGSGVIVDPAGLIVTNRHVINEAQEITVVLADRREFEARILLADERADLAVLKIEVRGERLPVIQIGDSDQLEVGDLVLAIGNPFGVGQTVTSGIVSGLARTIGVHDFRSFIQTDAAINPGNSGGALVDLDGRLVGITTAIYSQSGGSIGIGFATPTSLGRSVLQAAASGGKVVRPWLGASGQGVNADIAASLGLPRPQGVLVKEVAPGSPAAQAGLHGGDVILA
ncbi:MAG TPA: trypsin-like peptidase domain-containing protein, partial [Stellaceae bacterium]